jgi:hypothetical protein
MDEINQIVMMRNSPLEYVSQQKFLDLFDVVEEEEMKESRSEFE